MQLSPFLKGNATYKKANLELRSKIESNMILENTINPNISLKSPSLVIDGEVLHH